MGFQIRLLGRSSCMYYLVCFCFIVVNAVNEEIRGDATEKGLVFIHGKSFIGKIDDDYVCATLDWWPPQKCDYGRCSWGLASLLNLDLNNKILLNAVKAFCHEAVGTVVCCDTFFWAELNESIYFSACKTCKVMQNDQ